MSRFVMFVYPQSSLNLNRNSNNYNSDKIVKNSKFNTYNGKTSWRRAKHSNKIHSRGARERRDLFDQFESLMSL